ncbi:MAG TPA: hypothetical protein VMD98_09185 [Bryocella sp.]|nr:hypothetical protein [Bryocella sp.]
MYRLTSRRQNINVMTVSMLRSELESLSTAACRFSIAKVHRDHVSVRGDYTLSGKKKHSLLLLPAYPTGWPDDETCNNLNVVLDPLSFEGIQDCTERNVFAPLLGREVLEHYEKMHPDAAMPISRCC